MKYLLKKQSAQWAAIIMLGLATITLPTYADFTQRVEFPRGRTTAVLQGSIAYNEVNKYMLRARVGQTMMVHLTSKRNRAKFDLYLREDRRALVNRGAEDTTDWEGELPDSGDYVISVYSVDGAATYTLEVTIR